MAGILYYDSNNSGGDWWLKEKDWDALAAAGWNVHWAHLDPKIWNGSQPVAGCYDKEKMLTPIPKTHLKYMGAFARSCAKRFESMEQGIEEFAKVAKQNPEDLGCSCCGPPHNFEWYDDNGSTKYFDHDFYPEEWEEG